MRRIRVKNRNVVMFKTAYRKCKSIYFAILFAVVCFFVVLNNHFWLNRSIQLHNDENSPHLEEKVNIKKLGADPMRIYKSDCKCRNDQIGLVRNMKNNKIYDVYKLETLLNENGSGDVEQGTLLYNIDETEYSKAVLTCNLYTSLRRGKHQKVIAYSLFGSRVGYHEKLKKIAEQAKKIYPGWVIRVYYDRSIDKSIICDIECHQDKDQEYVDNIDFCNAEKIELNFNGEILNGDYILRTIWRFLPVGDTFTDAFVSRDTDSFLLQREGDAVKAWLESDKAGHIMRDNPYHNEYILAGMWGFRRSVNVALADQIFSMIVNPTVEKTYNQEAFHVKVADQTFLRTHVYKKILDHTLVHDSYNCKVLGGVGWPTKRDGDCFVGGFDCNSTNAYYICPVECRPADHKEWLYC